MRHYDSFVFKEVGVRATPSVEILLIAFTVLLSAFLIARTYSSSPGLTHCLHLLIA
jgi:hypothetical protein